MKARFLVIVERGQSNYSAYSRDLPGCVATGKTVEDTLAEMRSAVEFHLKGILEEGEPIPTPKSLSSYVHETDEISVDDILTTIEVELPEAVAA